MFASTSRLNSNITRARRCGLVLAQPEYFGKRFRSKEFYATVGEFVGRQACAR
jgi:hypothetical protein